MRIPLLLTLGVTVARASLFGSSSTTSTAASASSSVASSTTAATEVEFLEVLQTAGISSMSCLITLVNMTTTNIGTCLALTTLAPLVVGAATGEFSASLDGYLTTACAETCGDSDIADAQAQIDSSCSGASADTDLVLVLDAILGNYAASYKTLACSVYFNSTGELCLPSVLNTSSVADDYTFFDNLVSGSNLDQYSSAFLQAECTGCVYELYKASVYTLPAIRDNNITEAMGSYLLANCTAQATTSTPNWSDVTNQQIPDSLEVNENPDAGTTTATTSAASRRILIPIPFDMPSAGLGLCTVASAMLVVPVWTAVRTSTLGVAFALGVVWLDWM